MTRTEENAKTIKNLEEINGEYTFEKALLISIGMMTRVLIDISKSLAVIADKSQEDNT